MSESEVDPKFVSLKKEFVDSLPGRAQALSSCLATLRAWIAEGRRLERSEEYASLCKEIQLIAHKLAGVAGSFGFAELSRLSGELDDGLDEVPAPQAAEVLRWGEGLVGKLLSSTMPSLSGA